MLGIEHPLVSFCIAPRGAVCQTWSFAELLQSSSFDLERLLRLSLTVVAAVQMNCRMARIVVGSAMAGGGEVVERQAHLGKMLESIYMGMMFTEDPASISNSSG